MSVSPDQSLISVLLLPSSPLCSSPLLFLFKGYFVGQGMAAQLTECLGSMLELLGLVLSIA